jgi:hypothetical protein
MKVSEMSLRVYRSLYWANQGLLHALAALQELEQEPASPLPISPFNDKLHRTQAMIEETRALMNSNLAEWTGLMEPQRQPGTPKD